MKKSILDWVVLILVIIGAVNWGLVGIGVGDIVQMLLGSIPLLVKIIYILVGLAGLYLIYMAVKN